MLKALYLVLLLFIATSADRVSQWSNWFVLKDHSGGSGSIQSLLDESGIGEAQITAHPNPFNPAVVISISGAISSNAYLRIYGMNGNLIQDLTKLIRVGERSIQWENPSQASSMYLACLQDGKKVKSLKLILLK